MSPKNEAKFLLRLNQRLFEKLKNSAKKKRVSLNQLITAVLARDIISPGPADSLGILEFDEIKRRISPEIIAAVLFGSRSRGDAWEQSDIDIAFFVTETATITRDWYRAWDKLRLSSKISPLFCSLPRDGDSIGALILEIAVDGIVLFDSEDDKVTRFLMKLRDEILSGRFIRTRLHGQPVWRQL